MKKIKSFIKESIADFKKVPSWLVALSAVTVVLMNILANKGLFSSGYLALDCGFLVSWVMFLVMDIVTQRYGGKASFAVTIFDVSVALFMSLLMFGIAQIPETASSGWMLGIEASEALNNIIGNSILVVLVSLFAFIVASAVDVVSNVTLGRWMEKSKTFKGESGNRTVKGFFVYFVRAYSSTFLSQLTDNITFQFIAYNFLFAWFYQTSPGAMLSNGQAQLTIFMGALVGAVAELIIELAFAPIGYLAITKKTSYKKA
jgi:uncharacterized PurR-regulated membrane protein YhhQ (DUF165 family)